VYYQPTPPPEVTAAHEAWQYKGEPVFFEGDWYFPSVPTTYFDGNVMRRVGVYRGIPLYVDSTLTPGSIVYLPIGGNVMRPYERKRYGDLAGTTASRTPWYPIERDVEVSASGGAVGIQTPPLAALEQPVVPEVFEARPTPQPMAGTFTASGTFTTGSGTAAAPAAAAIAPPRQPMHVESIPAPRSNAGIWIEYNGSRWSSAGSAVPYVEDRFVQVGDYHGFPVYRQRNGPSNEIWIPAVIGGSLAPYRR
jgi:hypothetical protein